MLAKVLLKNPVSAGGKIKISSLDAGEGIIEKPGFLSLDAGEGIIEKPGFCWGS